MAQHMGNVVLPASQKVTKLPLSYVIGAHNEEACLAGTVQRLCEFLSDRPGSEIVISENASTDSTWEIAQSLTSESNEKVRIIAVQADKGLGSAWRTGLNAVSNEHCVLTAADLPFSFTDVESWEVAGRPSFAIGSKACRDSKVERTFKRRILSFSFYLIRYVLLGSRVHDSQGTLLGQTELLRECATNAEHDNYFFSTEIVTYAESIEQNPVEVPIELEPEQRPSRVRALRDPLVMVALTLSLRRKVLQWRAQHNSHIVESLEISTEKFASSSPIRSHIKSATAFAIITFEICAVLLIASLVSGSIVAAYVVVGVGGFLLWRRWKGSMGPPVLPQPKRDDAAHEVFWPSWFRWMLYVLGAVVLTLPAVFYYSSRIIGSHDDQYWVWQVWALGRNFRQGDFSYVFSDIIWPHGLHIWIADGFLPSTVGGIFGALIPNAAAAYNTAVLFALITTMWGADVVARRFTADARIRLLASFACVIAPNYAVRVQAHYNLLFAAPSLVLLALSIDIARHNRKPGSMEAVLLVLAYLSSGYYFVFSGILLCIAVVVSNWRMLGRLIAVGAVSCLLLVPFLIPKLQFEHRQKNAGAEPISVVVDRFGSDMSSYLQIPMNELITRPIPSYSKAEAKINLQESVSYFGAVLLFTLGSVLLLRSRERKFLLVSIFTFFILSLGVSLTLMGNAYGSRWLPFEIFVLKIPGLSGVRTPNRASFMLTFLAVAIFAMVVTWLRPRVTKKAFSTLCLISVAILILELRAPIPTNPMIPGSPQVQAAVKQQASHPNAVGMVLPDLCGDDEIFLRFQIMKEFRMVGCPGFTSAIPFATTLKEYRNSHAWAAFRCFPGYLGTMKLPQHRNAKPSAELLPQLREELGVTFVIFNRDSVCPEDNAAKFAALKKGADLVADDGSLAVFALHD